MPPVDELDAACLAHDIAYANNDVDTSQADWELARAALRTGGLQGIMVAAGMAAKQTLDPTNQSDRILRTENDGLPDLPEDPFPDDDGVDEAIANMPPIDGAENEAEAMEVAGEQGGSAGPESRGAGAAAGGSSLQALSTPIFKPLHKSGYTITFRTVKMVQMKNIADGTWTLLNNPTPAPAKNVEWQKNSRYVELPNRNMLWYIMPNDVKHFHDCVSYQIKSANTKITQVQVFPNTLNDGTVAWTNYNSINPNIFIQSNPTYQWAHKALAQQDMNSHPVPDPAATDFQISRILNAQHFANFTPQWLPRVQFHVPINVNACSGQENPLADGPDMDAFGTNMNWEYAKFSATVPATNMVGMNFPVKTWPRPIKVQNQHQRGLARGAPVVQPSYSERSAATAAGSWNLDAARFTGENESYWATLTMPVGPIVEMPIMQANPWSNSVCPCDAKGENPPTWMTMQNIIAPDGTTQNIEVVFRMETSLTVHFNDNAAEPSFSLLKTLVEGGTLRENPAGRPHLYAARYNRLSGSQFSSGENGWSRTVTLPSAQVSTERQVISTWPTFGNLNLFAADADTNLVVPRNTVTLSNRTTPC